MRTTTTAGKHRATKTAKRTGFLTERQQIALTPWEIPQLTGTGCSVTSYHESTARATASRRSASPRGVFTQYSEEVSS
jgi:hypothetical protein